MPLEAILRSLVSKIVAILLLSLALTPSWSAAQAEQLESDANAVPNR